MTSIITCLNNSRTYILRAAVVGSPSVTLHAVISKQVDHE